MDPEAEDPQVVDPVGEVRVADPVFHPHYQSTVLRPLRVADPAMAS